jgi:hypothetical protein
MAKVFERWTVLSHRPVEKLAENLWRVEGDLPDMPLKRVFTIARLGDGRLLFHNAVALEEAAMREIEAWGTPAYLVVPNGWHRLDAKIYKERYPGLRVLCPRGSRKRVSRVVPVDGGLEDFPTDERVRLFYANGVKPVEAVLEVRLEEGATLVFCDLVMNMPRHFPGASGLLYIIAIQGLGASRSRQIFLARPSFISR